MAVSAARSLSIVFSGDVAGTETPPVAVNAVSPGQIEIKNLASGFNTITVPTGGASVPTAVTIVPPAANAIAITLKGVTGDTGIRLHNTDPTTIALDASVTTIGLTAGSALTGMRFIWS